MNYLVYGPRGCGKTINADKIKEKLNCLTMNDKGLTLEQINDDIKDNAIERCVYFTSENPNGVHMREDLILTHFSSFELEHYNTMVRQLSKHGEDIIAALTSETIHILHMAVGIQGEVSELLEAIRDDEDNLLKAAESQYTDLSTTLTAVRADYSSPQKLLEMMYDGEYHILEELGDIEFYFTGLLQGIDFTIPDDFDNQIYQGWGLRALLEELVIVSGNILDKAKRISIYNKNMKDERPGLVEHVKKCRSLLTRIYKNPEIKTSASMARQHNIEKLLTGKNARYKSGRYSNEQANTRADKTN